MTGYLIIGTCRLMDPDPYFLGTKGAPYAVPDQMGFLDAMVNVLDNFTISDRQKEYLFSDTAESRTIYLI